MSKHVCVCACVCHQAVPGDLVACSGRPGGGWAGGGGGGGVIKDQGRRPFPVPGEDEWLCLKVAAFGRGAIRVSSEPAALAVLWTKTGPWV